MSAVPEPTDERLREEQTASDERLREEQTASDERLREEQTASDERLREEQTASDERLREEQTASDGADATAEQIAADALLRPVRPLNAFEDTVERLLQTIRLGVLRPGESLPPERELATRLGVSRDTVREAIKSLADAGYLVSRRGRYGGTFIADALPAPRTGDVAFSRTDIDDALRLREILETGAARMAACRTLSATEREALWSRLLDVRGAAPQDYRRLDSRLHLAITEAAGVPSLVPLVAQNRMRLNEMLDCIPLLPRNIAHSDEQHEAIVMAILAGDADGAAQTMAAHVWGSAALLHGFLD